MAENTSINEASKEAPSEEPKKAAFPLIHRILNNKRVDMLNHPEVERELVMLTAQNQKHMNKFRETNENYCQFFMKTGSCRYGHQCKREHAIPLASETLYIEEMYKDAFNKMKSLIKNFDDSLLEYEDEEIQEKYNEFYEDVVPEWKKYGNIVQFLCSNNRVPHLRGCVFIQYENIKSAIYAYVAFQGRYYGGYPLRISFSLLKDWKQAICAYNNSKCPKLNECNFLHIYRNPRHEYQVEGLDDRYNQERIKRIEKLDMKPEDGKQAFRGRDNKKEESIKKDYSSRHEEPESRNSFEGRNSSKKRKSDHKKKHHLNSKKKRKNRSSSSSSLHDSQSSRKLSSSSRSSSSEANKKKQENRKKASKKRGSRSRSKSKD